MFPSCNSMTLPLFNFRRQSLFFADGTGRSETIFFPPLSRVDWCFHWFSRWFGLNVQVFHWVGNVARIARWAHLIAVRSLYNWLTVFRLDAILCSSVFVLLNWLLSFGKWYHLGSSLDLSNTISSCFPGVILKMTPTLPLNKFLQGFF